MAKLVKLHLENDYNQTIQVEDEFKIHDVLIDADSLTAWVIIPTVHGGFFCTRAGLVRSIAVEHEDTVNGK